MGKIYVLFVLSYQTQPDTLCLVSLSEVLLCSHPDIFYVSVKVTLGWAQLIMSLRVSKLTWA